MPLSTSLKMIMDGTMGNFQGDKIIAIPQSDLEKNQ